MTATQTEPEAPAASAPVEVAPAARPGGLVGLLGTGDHKVVGRLYIGFSVLFLLAAGVTGQLFAIDKVNGTLGDTILTRDSVFQVATLHAVSGVFLFVVPLFLGIALVVVPLQVGAQTVAFPRAAAASFWAWLMGSGLLLASYAVNGGPGGGSRDGVGLWITALGLVLMALVLGAISVVTTVLTLRAPGMTLDRIPLFSWSMVATGVLWILSLPVLGGLLVLIYVDYRYGRTSFGINDDIYGRIRWVFLAPQAYAFAIPVLGFLADTAATAGRVRLPQRNVFATVIGAFTFLGFGAFVQPAVAPDSTDEPLVLAMSVLTLLGVIVVFGLVASGLRAGRVRPQSGLLFGIVAWLLLLIAAAAGAAGAVHRFHITGPLYQGAQTHLAVLAGTVAGVGALWYWATKIFGRPLSEPLGRLTAVVLLLGALTLAAPDAISGIVGNARESAEGIEWLNAVSAIGGAVVGLGVLLAIVGLLGGLRGASGADDPWDGLTLEWATASPPIYENFTTVPEVNSAEPLLDAEAPVTGDATASPAEASA